MDDDDGDQKDYPCMIISKKGYLWTMVIVAMIGFMMIAMVVAMI